MNPTQQKPADELRMSGKKFDQIMRQALQVKPKSRKVTKGSAKWQKKKKLKS